MNLKATSEAMAYRYARRLEEEDEPAGYHGGSMTSVIIALVSILFLLVILVVANRKVTRTQGKVMKYHVFFGIFSAICILLFPDVIAIDIFSPLSVAIVGTVFPTYESIRAVATIGTDDDTAWLMYWVVQGTFSFLTEWVDGIAENSVFVREHWYEFEFCFMLWLFLPWTDGATVICKGFVEPVIAPLIQPIVARTEGFIEKIVLASVNVAHLGIVWVAFVFLDPTLKRFIWILIGTAYPIMASLVAVTTSEGEDDTQWLTYWSCFSILFIIVDFLETFLGFIPGFYTLAIICTMYLMLPLFNGAEKVYRYVLVPVAGLQELLLKRDSEMIKYEVLKQLPEERREAVLSDIADSFKKTAGEGKTSTKYSSMDDTPSSIV